MSKTSSKTTLGNFFEDFRVGQEFRHATPRTPHGGRRRAECRAYGSRFAVNSSDEFARSITCRARRSTISWCSMS